MIQMVFLVNPWNYSSFLKVGTLVASGLIMLVVVKSLYSRRFILPFLLGALLTGLFESSARASSAVVIGWNQSSDTNVVGYKLYYGTTSQDYSNVVVLGNVTNATISGISPGTKYFFAATTYTLAGEESAYSGEVSYTVPMSENILTAATYAASSHQFSFAVNGSSGSQYVVEASTNLITWIPLITNSAPFVFVDSGAASFGRRFYQALPVP